MSVSSFKVSDLVYSKAAKTYAKLPASGYAVAHSRKTTRLNLSYENDVCKSARTSANIYIETLEVSCFRSIKKWLLTKMNKKFVPLSLQDSKHPIYINVNSLSKRLGITKESIYAHAKSNTLEKLIRTKHALHLDREKKIIEKMQKMNETHPFVRKKLIIDGQKTGISPNTLYKIIGISQFTRLHTDFKKVNFGEQIVLMRKTPCNNLEIYHFSNRILGVGGFGIVKLITDVEKGETQVAKIVKFHSNAAVKGIFKEQAILEEIHANGLKVGIQRTPHAIFDFKNEMTGYCAYRYDGTITRNALSKMSAKERLDCALQLLKGLNTCADMQITIGDIKPKNCLIKKVSTGYECVLSDFGGARNLTKEDLNWEVYTLKYTPIKDKKRFELLVNKYPKTNDLRKKLEIFEEARNILLARDVYSLGLTLKVMLLEDDKIDSTQKAKLSALIKKMTDSNFRTRISASEALADFQKIL